jgi:hypothetical protein
MKTIRYFLLFVLILSFEEATNANQRERITTKYPIITYCEVARLDVLTVYNPVREQTDKDPLITASNKTIPIDELQCGGLRWIALSRDLLKRFGGTIVYGDTVTIRSGDSVIDGEWIVQDTMNERFTSRGDLLFDNRVRSAGKWKDVGLLKKQTLQAFHLSSGNKLELNF